MRKNGDHLAISGLILALACCCSVHAQDQKPATLPNYPLDTVVDAEGTAFVVDRNFHGVWKWKSGEQSAFFEGSPKYRTPLNAARSLAIEPDGTLIVGDSSTRDVYRVREGGKAEPITGGKIGIPMDLAVDSKGNIFVADLELRQLVRIPTGSAEVEVVAKDINPRGIFADAQDNIWVVSQNVQQLQIVPAGGGSPEVIVDHRVFEFPHQVVVNSKGEAFVTDGYRKAIWKVVRGAAPEVLFEGAPLDNPVGLSLLDDRILVTDPRTRSIYRMNDADKPELWFEIK